jgi:hypothetical protein
MDHKFSNENKDKIVRSLKYHLNRQLKGYNIDENQLQEIVNFESRTIHDAFPDLNFKDYNKKVVKRSFNYIQNLIEDGPNKTSPMPSNNNPQTLTSKEILQQSYEQYSAIRDNELKREMPTVPDFGMKMDDPIQDIDSELQKLTNSRDQMDRHLAPLPPKQGDVDINVKKVNMNLERQQNRNINNITLNKVQKTDTNQRSDEDNNISFLNNNDDDDNMNITFESQFQPILLNNEGNNFTNHNNNNVGGLLPYKKNKVTSIEQDQIFLRKEREKISEMERNTQVKTRGQDIIIPRSIQQGYYDKENNIIIHSIDRNWTNDNETRYRFRVKFEGNMDNTSVRNQGVISTRNTFNNVVGLQLVRIILPNESLHTMVELNTDRSVGKRNRMFNSLQYPYLNFNIGSFNGEIEGTNDAIQHSFTNIIYDNDFKSDLSNQSSGYLSYIPSDKTQKRIFYPTPLANLKMMDVELTNPFGNVLNNEKDALQIKRMFFGNSDISAGYSTPANVDISNSIPYVYNGTETDVSEQNYIVIQTQKYFRAETVQIGDIVQFTDVSVPEDSDNKAEITTTLEDSTKVNFQNFINRKEGHHVVAIAHYDDITDNMNVPLTSGPNTVGYANFIVIEKKKSDYTEGYQGGYLYGGSNAQDYALHQHMYLYDQTSNAYGLNTNKQVHIVFKVYTRHYDGSDIQPQNNN